MIGIGRLEWRHATFNLAGNSFHCRSRTASDVTRELVITFVDELKDCFVEKSGQSNHRPAKWSWLARIARESGQVPTRRKLLTVVFATKL